MELVRNWYGRRMSAWENHLCCRATNRVVRPFEWGLDWTENWPHARREPRGAETPEEYLYRLNRAVVSDSDSFFGYEKLKEFRVEGDQVTFRSPMTGPFPENNQVHARYFPAKNSRKAVVVLPHWNASYQQHAALCAGIQKLGISALRLSLPYHDARMPPELERADYAVSSNLARTIDATRQAVIDSRACVDWLESRGYESIGIVGTSLGSCYAFLASAHDPRIKVNVFNHCSSYFADVVWTGLSTQHIRKGLEGHVDLERLRAAWDCVSPAHYMDRFSSVPKKSLFLYTTYDTTFLPHLSEMAVDHVRQRGLNPKVVVLPCGHYTLGEAPFKFIAGYHICSFLKRYL